MPGSCRGEEAIGQGVKKFMPQQEMPATSCDNLPILSYLQIYVSKSIYSVYLKELQVQAEKIVQ